MSRGWELFLFYLLINLLFYLLINLSAGWGGGGTGARWGGLADLDGHPQLSLFLGSPLPWPSPSPTTFCTDLLSGRNSGFA